MPSIDDPIDPALTKPCSSCGVVKNILQDIGYKIQGGRRYAKSMCRECWSARRSGGGWVRTTVPLPPSPEGFQRCPRCKETKPFTDYGRSSSRPCGRAVYCRACANAYRRERIAAKSSEEMAEFRRRKALSNSKFPETRKRARLRVFNMTLEQYEQILADQGGVCMICRRPETAKNRSGLVADLSVDHDHRCCPAKGTSCGACIRGLLCSRCNNGLGLFRDDVDVLAAAINYLNTTSVTAEKRPA